MNNENKELTYENIKNDACWELITGCILTGKEFYKTIEYTNHYLQARLCSVEKQPFYLQDFIKKYFEYSKIHKITLLNYFESIYSKS